MDEDWSSKQDKELFRKARNQYAAGHFSEALAGYTVLARRGYKSCQIFLGWMYYEGKGATKDSEIALDWFKKAGDAGSAEGRFYCARVLESAENIDEALTYLRQSAAQGYAPAITRLGRFLLHGKGVQKNVDEALKLLNRGARLGNIFAKREIAVHKWKNSRALPSRALGFVLFVWSIVAGAGVALASPQSDRIKG